MDDFYLQRLVSSAQRGENDAFAELYRVFFPTAYQAAFFVCQDEQIARDAAQSAFMVVLERLEQLRDPWKFKPWVARIAANAATADIRKLGVYSSQAPDALRGDDDANPESLFVAEEERNRIHAAIDALPVDHQLTVWLYYFMELDVRAISQALSIPEGTVKSRLHRARKEIARRLNIPATKPRPRGDERASW